MPLTDTLDSASLRGTAGLAMVEHFAETESTMDRARVLAIDPRSELPALVVADRQTLGRGRRGARWWQAPGSLAVSLVIDGREYGGTGGPRPTWSLACGVALAEAIHACEPALAPQVRWPNDIEVAGRKLAGIFVETAGDSRVIFGIGVNTTGSANDAPTPVRHRVATLPDLVGRPLGRQMLLSRFLPALFELLTEVAADPARLACRYQPLCSLAGNEIRIHTAEGVSVGRCLGIAADGRLLLDTDAGLRMFVSGSLTDPADVWHGDE
jgi:BirA family biotin operon repressor/biotin-[acetyl-CoA-carboxylase] ligase